MPEVTVRERKSLSTRSLLAAVGAAALVPFILLIAVAFINRLSMSRDAELDRLASASRSLATALDRELGAYVDKVRLLSGLRALTKGGLPAARDSLFDARAAVGGDFVLYDDNGQQLINTRVVDDSPLPVSKNLKWIKQAVASDKPVISDLGMGTVKDGGYAFSILVSFRSDTGQTLVLAYLPPVTSVQGLLKHHITDPSWAGAILDGSGRIVARTAQQERLFGQFASPDFIAKLTDKEGLQQTTDLQDRPSYTAYRASDLNAWKVVVWVPKAAVAEPGWSIARSMVIAVSVALLLSLTAGHFISQFVQRPINTLIESARQLGRGQVPKVRPTWMREANLVNNALSEAAKEIAVRQAVIDQATAAARENERLHHELTENAPVMLWISDAQGRCLHINKRLREFWGVNEDLAQFDWSATLHPDDSGPIATEVMSAIAARRGFSVEGRYRTATGEFRTLRTEATPRFSDSCEFIGMLGTNIDVTDAIAATAALKENEERLRIAASAAGLGVFEWRIAADRAEFENARMLEIFGHDRDETHLSHERFMASYIHPEDAESFQRTLETALATPSALQASCRIRRKSDGAWRWIEIAGNILVGSDGTPERLIGVVADITARRQAEEELSRTSTLLQAVCDGVTDLIFVKDRASRFLFANPATAQALGLSLDDLPGKTGLEEVQDQAEAAIILANDRQVIETGAAITVEETFTGANGRQTYLSNKAPLRDACGTITGLVAVVRDISARKDAEEHTKLLLREVSHRAKNILAVTQAIVRQTARDCDPQVFAKTVSGRLAGLAASHDLLVEGEWRSVAIRGLVVAQLSHYRDLIGNRISVQGPDFGLRPAATQTLGMALHELATNASKYGALSNDQGQVHLSWEFKQRSGEQRLIMVWQERNGPAVKKPQRRGFGHSVTTRLVETGLEASVEVDYATDGLQWTLDAPALKLAVDIDHPEAAQQILETV